MKSDQMKLFRAVLTVILVFGSFGLGLVLPVGADFNWPLVFGGIVFTLLVYIILSVLTAHLVNQEHMIRNQQALIRHFLPEAELEEMRTERRPEEKIAVKQNLTLKK